VQHLERFEPYRFFPLPRAAFASPESGRAATWKGLFPGEPEHLLALHFASESTRRVELNAMTSDQLIEFVEGKLTELGITKVVPAKDRLAEAFRLFARSKLVEEAVEKVIKEMPADTIRAG
jgi:hypothetical protein